MSVFRDKVAVITGAGSGIGRALARELARQGALVVATDRDERAARETAQGIAGAGGSAESAALDVVDAEAVQRIIDETARRHGRLDYIFNNAGIGIFAEAKDHTLEDWNKTLDVNLRGVIHGIHAAYPIMRQQRSGHIVNTASLAGLVPASNEIAYAASKFAVVGITTTLRVEAAAYGVKASAVCPGFVDTPILFEHVINKYAERMPFRSREEVKRELGVKAMNADRAAQEICRGVARNRAVIVVTTHARVFHLLYRLFPSLFLWLAGKALQRARRLYQG